MWPTFRIIFEIPYHENCWSQKPQIWKGNWPWRVLTTNEKYAKWRVLTTDEKYAKLGQRGGEVVTLFYLLLEFRDPIHISGTVEARNFKHVHKNIQI